MKYTYKTIPSGVRNKIADRSVMRTLIRQKFSNILSLAKASGIPAPRLVKILNGNRGTISELLDLAIVMEVPYGLYGFFWGTDARKVGVA